MIKDQDSVRAGMVNALQNGSGYDFIINNSYRMSKDDLARVAAECMMAVYSKLSEEDYDAYEKEVADSLESGLRKAVMMLRMRTMMKMKQWNVHKD